MLPRIRTIALLMLAAGLSLGVFAARALSAFRLPADVPSSASPLIEGQVRLYQQDNQLDASRTELVRRELMRYDRAVMDQMWKLRKEYDAWFRWAREGTQKRIAYVLETGMMPPSSYGLDPLEAPRAPGAPQAPGERNRDAGTPGKETK